MKGFIEAPAAIVAAALACLCAAPTPAAHAVEPVVTLTGSAALTRHPTAARFHVTTSFSTDTPGAQLFTVQQAVIFFPDHAGTNGRLFPSCGAAQIRRLHGNLARCPRGSKVGAGTVRAQALQLGIAATGRVTLFNSRRGKAIAFNFQTIHPVRIDKSIDAPLTQLHGGPYGEKLTLVVPRSLQEIVSGVWVGVERFDVTLTGAFRAHGVRRSFLRARRCPQRAMHGVFGFTDGTTGQAASATADAKVHCTLR
jgi:hypothetical protein